MSKEIHQLYVNHNVFIVWKPEYNLGIPIIDEHHRGIVSIINSLYFGMQNNYLNEILTPIVDMMDDYARIHFKIEEGFLEKINFPDLEKHKALHEQLSANSRKLGHDSIKNRDTHHYMDFLKQWWINHIRHEDLAYKNFIFK